MMKSQQQGYALKNALHLLMLNLGTWLTQSSSMTLSLMLSKAIWECRSASLQVRKASNYLHDIVPWH